MFPIQEREEVMDYTELKKLMSEQKVEMTAAERIKAYFWIYNITICERL